MGPSQPHPLLLHPLRDDHTVGADLRRKPTAGEGPDLDRHPYATCELGGGVQVTYHRRPRVTADEWPPWP